MDLEIVTIGDELLLGFTIDTNAAHMARALAALGVRIVRQVGDPSLARAADAILGKVAAVVPKALTPLLSETRLFVPPTVAKGGADALSVSRAALVDRRKLRITYADASERASARTIRPLGVFFWGKTWTLAAWCELRKDFRNFRLDRVSAVKPVGKPFRDEPGKTLADMLAQYGPEAVKVIDA